MIPCRGHSNNFYPFYKHYILQLGNLVYVYPFDLNMEYNKTIFSPIVLFKCSLIVFRISYLL